MPHKSQKSFDLLKILNIIFIVISVAVCSILMLFTIPGMELLDTSPNWLLIWLVAWSLGRSADRGAIAGLTIGWIYDGIIGSTPSHALPFIVAGVITSRLQKQKYIGEDFISVALIVFFMTVLTEAIFAWLYLRTYFLSIERVWSKYQQVAIVSAIITSLWSPIFYYPFNLWQKRFRQMQKKYTN